MANIKSAKKSINTSKIKSESNKDYQSRIKNSIKKIDKAVQNKDKEAGIKELKIAIVNLDKAASKGLIKQNTCNRQKARLNKKVKEI